MKIVFLDSKTIGDDIDLSEYDKLDNRGSSGAHKGC